LSLQSVPKPGLTPTQVEIDEIQSKLNSSTAPDVSALQAKVNRLTPYAASDPKFRPELHSALLDYEQAVKDKEAYDGLKLRLPALLAARENEISQERQARAQYATKQLQQLKDEYISAAKAVCRAYQQAHLQMLANHSIPGADIEPLGDFHIPELLPAGWQGTTAQAIRNGSLPFLTTEALRRAA
jgi:hypothetical protein